MIDILPLKNPNGLPIGIEAHGHSLLHKRGSDPLCAGVSALLDNLHLSLCELLMLKVTYKCDHGYWLCVATTFTTDALAQLLLRSTLLGLINLSKQYPQHINVNDPQTIDSLTMVEERYRAYLADH